MGCVEDFEDASCEGPDQVADGTEDHEVYGEEEEDWYAAFIWKDERGEHSQSVDDDLDIEELEEEAYDVGWLFLGGVLSRWLTAEGLPCEVENVCGAYVFHVRLDPRDDLAQCAAEDTA